MAEALSERVRALMAPLLGIDPAGQGDVVREDVAQWDSLRHIELIFLIEEEFGVTLEEAQMAELDSLSAAVRLLESHGAA
jgi:acyl carrier protein